ncbi:hypothetical protein DSN45_14045 [Staphylococcus xylosus]|uniref:Uncharacterized protein n=1 Tax=Companilactobacillus halodurans TaxID=2584183 RepID=A0A5P0ZS81_9LACO|nr:hypothetical protein [Staphylococcus xylosus]MQS77074.1 hypothetical protein [Companilactobacillus halodurans]
MTYSHNRYDQDFKKNAVRLSFNSSKPVKIIASEALCQILLIDSFTELEAKRLLVLFLYLVLFSFVEA